MEGINQTLNQYTDRFNEWRVTASCKYFCFVFKFSCIGGQMYEVPFRSLMHENLSKRRGEISQIKMFNPKQKNILHKHKYTSYMPL